jgi:hypothetical protein
VVSSWCHLNPRLPDLATPNAPCELLVEQLHDAVNSTDAGPAPARGEEIA